MAQLPERVQRVVGRLCDPENPYTLREAGREIGITGDGVREMLKRYGLYEEVGRLHKRARMEHAATVRRERKAAAFDARIEKDKGTETPCLVCGGPAFGSYKTCGPECARAFEKLRFRLDRERWVVTQARSILRHRENRRPSEVARAERIMRGEYEGPNRQFIVPGSDTSRVTDQLGLTPEPGPYSRQRVQVRSACAATNLDGTPCKRSAPDGHDTCHIHRGLAGRKKVA